MNGHQVLLQTCRGPIPLGPRALVMGVLNCTPDSFSDGGRFLEPAAAVAHAMRMADEGADLIDVGGESTRPGSDPVGDDEQITRTVPVIEQIAGHCDLPIAIDTRSAGVARAAIAAGASMVNDVSALRHDPQLVGLVAESGAAVVLMHMLGCPKDMQDSPRYDDVVQAVKGFLGERVGYCQDYGIGLNRIVVDPGIGFGKTLAHNLDLLGRLQVLSELGLPVLVGTSRKQFIGQVLGTPVDRRLTGTLATIAWAVLHGARIVRVHDVLPARQTVEMLAAIARPADR